MARPAKITDQSVECAIRLLAFRAPKGEVKRMLSKRFKLSARSSERVMARAREEIAEASGKTIDQHRMDAFATLEQIIADKKTTTRERILAQAELSKLLGLNKAERIEVSGPDGGAIQTEQKAFDPKNCTPEQLAALHDILKARVEPS